MLILAKAVMAVTLGFIVSAIFGFILLPLLKRYNIRQKVSETLGEKHLKKDGMPTMGGLIFIIPTLLVMLFLYLRGSININYNVLILFFVFIAYAILGAIDDLIKIKFKNNGGLSISVKLLAQMFIALVFFYIFMSYGGTPVLEISLLNISLDLGWTYGIFVLIVLIGTTNAVNLTDGLDGLAGGLSLIAFAAMGIVSWGTSWIPGFQDIAIFCFVLTGCLAGFLLFNSKPAKVFMGDTGSLALGGALATIAILTSHELLLIVVGGVFVIEALSTIIQIFAIKKLKRKVFLMAPLHHHFEQLNWEESDIAKLFWSVGFILAMMAVTYAVWI